MSANAQEAIGHKIVYQIVEVKGRKKPLWNRAGVAFVNRDGSMNLTVDALPGCRFQIRDPQPRPEPEPEPAPKKTATVNRNSKFKR